MRPVSARQPLPKTPARLDIRGMFLMVRRSAAGQSVMLLNAFALSFSAGSAALLGFAYWWFAARQLPADVVGLAAAAISLMNLLALIGEVGMGTLLIGELSRSAKSAASLISAALFCSLFAAITVGVIYLAVAWSMSLDFGAVTANWENGVLFAFAVGLTGVTLVLDQALVGLLRAHLQMYRAVSFAAIKLIVLVAAVLVGPVDELGVLLTWIVGQFLSVVLLCGICFLKGHRIWCAPDLYLLKPMVKTVFRHHVLSIVIQGPALLLPSVVAFALSPRANAAFYAAWTLVNVVLLVPASLSAVLYSVGARDNALFQQRLKVSLGISTFVCTSAGIVLLFSSEFIMAIFNPSYPSIVGTSLKLFGFATLGVMVKYHYVVVQRLRYRMLEASIVLAAGGILEILGAIIGARAGDLLGLTEGWLVGIGVETLLVGPIVIGAFRHGLADRAPQNEPLEEGLA